MAKLFIPFDRVGLMTCQKSISGTFQVLNALLNQGVELFWQRDGIRFLETPAWPEGHYYQCGFVLEDSISARDILDAGDVFVEQFADLPEPTWRLRPLNIAFYNGRGAEDEFSAPLVKVLQQANFSYNFVSDKDVREGKLKGFDMLLVPGSPDAGECYYAGLGDKGYNQIRSFIADHGHYMGICGGAYLPLSSYHDKNPYWLNIVNATDQEDLDYWRAGSGFVRCRINDDMHPIFSSVALGHSSSMDLVFWEGPAMQIMGENVRSLAHFETLLASGKDPLKPHWDLLDNHMAVDAIKDFYNCLTPELFTKMLHGKCAIAEADYHRHKLLLYSPHPEMGNLGTGPWAESRNFLLIYNGLFYLSAQ